MAKKRADLPPELIETLITYLAEGDTITRATRRLQIDRRLLYNAEQADPAVKRKVREALAAGARFQIDQALEQQKKAETKDQAIIADKFMQAAARRAELVAPHAYGKQALPVMGLPEQGSGKLTIAWQVAEQMQDDADERRNDSRLAHATDAKLIDAKPLDVVYEDAGNG